MENLKGMAWMTLAMLCFAITDAFIKAALATLPIGQVVFLFSLGGAVIFGIWAILRGENVIAPSLFTGPFLLRMGSEVVATICVVISLAVMDLSLMSAILQANPLLVTLGAAVFLGQRVGWRRWLAISIGLVGVLVIVRPGLAGFDVTTLWAVAGVIGLAGRDLATRIVPRDVSTLLLAAWGFVGAGAAGLVIMVVEGRFAVPDGITSLQLVGALLFALVAYYSIAAAMRVGEIAAVTPLRYTRLVFALTLALVVFGERPDLWTLTGAAIVIATGLYTLVRERKAIRD